MLNDIIAKVSEKTGISNEQATTAVTTVIDFLKAKLPPPLASQIDGILNGDGKGALDTAKSAFGSLFEKK